MKICFVAHSARNGGAERSLLETIDALRQRGVECAVLAPSDGPFTRSLTRMDIPHKILPFKRWAAQEGGPLWRRLARTLATLALCLPAALWIRREQADLVYSNTITIGIGGLAAWLARRPHIWHLRELGYKHNRVVFDLGARMSLAAMRATSRLCLANSRCVAEHYEESLRPRAIHVIYQCVRLDDTAAGGEPPPFDGMRLAVIGALSPEKRQDEAIEAVGQLREAGREVLLLIVGEGDRAYESSLRHRVADLGIEDSVRFVGGLESAAGVIRWADTILNCSRHEAFGRVTVESMLAATPVIGARSGGTAELIREGENGLLYEPGDVTALVGHLMALADDPGRAEALARTAQLWAREQFTTERYADRLLQLLQSSDGADAPLAASNPRNKLTSRSDVTDTE